MNFVRIYLVSEVPISSARLLRSFLEELRRCEPIEERIWVHPQSQASWPLQPLFLG